ncbi:hypothetical protein [Sphingobacterium faecale]|uniref:Tetratricopeptide repeat protein n=1 Tax=Sphingobacterium faecale TaxID=2803775 RepID=A0ABS1QXT7_9SPHI|nr:hypothetical protein [Sphingobacterium faecale]MBL1407232.1 hypothetical protein [Sphingobacterium faecale]
MENSCMKHVEEHWQTLTVSANGAFEQGDWQLALSLYNDALYRAEVLNDHIGECMRLKIPFIQVFLISCNNLAHTYQQLCREEEGENMLKRGIHYLFHLIRRKQIEFLEVQSDLKAAIANYVSFVQQSEEGDTKQRDLVEMVNEQLLENDLITTDQ